VDEKENKKNAISDVKKKEIIQELRKKNYRITNQRMMLLDIILDGNCTSCKEIYYKAVKKDPGIGTATVYRIMNILEDIRVINRKNMYEIQYHHWDDEENKYKIVLDDQTEIELSEQKWKSVIASGLRSCGFTENQKLKSVELVDKNVS
jgi:Fur family ferric uptake transcriptional regulator